MTNQEQTEPTVSGAQRCHQLLTRIVDIVGDEFADLTPADVVFVLNWLQHRYFVEIEYLVRGKQVPEPEPAQHVMQPVRI